MICLVGSVTADAARPRRASKAPQTRTAGTVKSERQRTEKEIAETRSKLKQTQKQTREKLEHLEGINAGIRTCWYDPHGRPTRPDIMPDYRIADLAELPPLLERI